MRFGEHGYFGFLMAFWGGDLMSVFFDVLVGSWVVVRVWERGERGEVEGTIGNLFGFFLEGGGVL